REACGNPSHWRLTFSTLFRPIPRGTTAERWDECWDQFGCGVGNERNMALTVKGIAGLNKPGLYGDGKGLYLHVAAGGCKSWILRFQLAKRRRDIGLGPLQEVTPAAAR